MRLLKHRGLLLGVALIALACAVALSARLNGAPAVADHSSALSDAAQGAALMQQARETGDPTLYGRAAAAFDAALKRDPHSVEGLLGKGALALAMHQFRAGLALGEQARTLDPQRALVYGVIGDAQIELGQYDAAVDTLQTMNDLRPDLSSYSRAAYARELNGDTPGAIMLHGSRRSNRARPTTRACSGCAYSLEICTSTRVTWRPRSSATSTRSPNARLRLRLAGAGPGPRAQGRFDEARALYQQAIAACLYPSS